MQAIGFKRLHRQGAELDGAGIVSLVGMEESLLVVADAKELPNAVGHGFLVGQQFTTKGNDTVFHLNRFVEKTTVGGIVRLHLQHAGIVETVVQGGSVQGETLLAIGAAETVGGLNATGTVGVVGILKGDGKTLIAFLFLIKRQRLLGKDKRNVQTEQEKEKTKHGKEEAKNEREGKRKKNGNAPAIAGAL